MDWGYTHYGAYAIIFCSLGTTGASVEKGLMRFVGTCVGILVGFAMIGLIGDNRWLMMAVMSVYLVIIGWGIQTSRYTYAWYVGGFVPLVVWASNYPHFDSTFAFGVNRWLETVAGIVSYSVVDVLFWPRSSGRSLHQNAAPLWGQVAELFAESRRQLTQPHIENIEPLRAEIASRYATVDFDMQQALLDTPHVANHKHEWDLLRQDGGTLVSHLDMWRESAIDCRDLPIIDVLPGLDATMNRIERRLGKFRQLWDLTLRDDLRWFRSRHPLRELHGSDLEVADIDPIAPDEESLAALPRAEQVVVRNFIFRLDLLDQDTNRVMRRLRVLAGLDSRKATMDLAASQIEPPLQPRPWDVDRFLRALFPALSFIGAYFFWIYVQPPTGVQQVSMTGTLALMILREPTNPAVMAILFTLTILVCVAPIVWLLMPALSSPESLLALIFIYTFFFSYLGGRSPILKIAPLATFATMAQISNSQHYSFQGTTNGALMMLLTAPPMTISWYMLTPMRPEQALRRTVQRFYHGCSRVCLGLFDQDQQARRDDLEQLVLPTTAAIRNVQPKLGPSLGRNEQQQAEADRRFGDLIDNFQHVTSQLIAIQYAHDRVTNGSEEIPQAMQELNQLARRVNDAAQHVFDRWVQFQSPDEADSLDTAVERLENAINHMTINWSNIASPLGNDPGDAPAIPAITGDYQVLLGSLRGLVRAIVHADVAISRIDWKEMSATRF